MRIALAGNPNSGKTTLFNSLTGSNQYVGNWPGVTVEQKTGHLRKNKHLKIIDLPGIYSLSPYTTEEEIARSFLLDEKPDAIINIVDGTNLERNLYLTTQLLDLNIPLVLAVNMSDVIEKTGDKIDLEKLSTELSVPVVLISALKGSGLEKLTELTMEVAQTKKQTESEQTFLKFNQDVENVLDHIAKIAFEDTKPDFQRWYQVKLFERDQEMRDHLALDTNKVEAIDEIITLYEDLVDEDSESIITSERYRIINNLVKKSYEKSRKVKLSTSDKIDRIVTNRILALPIFVVVMFFVYFLSISTIVTWTTDFVNENIFDEGWFLFGKGRSAYTEKVEEYEVSETIAEAFETEIEQAGIKSEDATNLKVEVNLYDEEGNLEEVVNADYQAYQEASAAVEPEPGEFGPWIPSIPDLIDQGLTKLNVSTWLHELVVDGIVAGVGAVLGFLPQMFV